jgi:nucleoside-diphosphate-sugar epimerase
LSILITGATGFLSSQLLPLLAARQDKLLVLVRNKPIASLHFSDIPFNDQLHLLQGDLCQPSLGINDEEWQQHKDNITEIWHCAANLSFSPRHKEDVMRTNFEGTLMLLEKAKQCPRLNRFYYVSTAFVHGDSDNTAKEDVLLPRGSFSFLNYYEESKYRAEEKLRQSCIPFCIFRPAVIMGHSVTGDASSMVTYFGFFTALQKAFSNGRHIPGPGEPLRIEGINGRRNHICVDHLASMMNAIALSGRDAGKTFHLAYAEQGQVADIFNAINRCLGSNFIIDKNPGHLNLTEVLARKLSSDYHPYIMRHDPVLDRSNTLSVLKNDLALDIPVEAFLYKMYRAYNHII